jgi:hypothetical protein
MHPKQQEQEQEQEQEVPCRSQRKTLQACNLQWQGQAGLLQQLQPAAASRQCCCRLLVMQQVGARHWRPPGCHWTCGLHKQQQQQQQQQRGLMVRCPAVLLVLPPLHQPLPCQQQQGQEEEEGPLLVVVGFLLQLPLVLCWRTA